MDNAARVSQPAGLLKRRAGERQSDGILISRPPSGALDIRPATLEEPPSSFSFVLIYCRVNYTCTHGYIQSDTYTDTDTTFYDTFVLPPLFLPLLLLLLLLLSPSLPLLTLSLPLLLLLSLPRLFTTTVIVTSTTIATIARVILYHTTLTNTTTIIITIANQRVSQCICSPRDGRVMTRGIRRCR